jgi:N-acetyl-D-muramate 6-phosphate phosphatase
LSRLHDGGLKAVFFDLDGTLVDTAPDMVDVLQALQHDHGMVPVAYELGRSYVSNGAMGLLRLGFPDFDDDARQAILPEFLGRYAGNVAARSRLFAGLETLLAELDAARVPWGVVTNKPAHLTDPLLAALELAGRAACAVSGDTLAVRKPDPGPLLHACELARVEPARSVYVGDSARDIQAGHAAGMATVAAAYGYVVDGDDPAGWGAEQIAADPEELAQILRKAVNLIA